MQKVVQVIESGIAEGLHLGAQVVVLQRGRVIADLAVGQAEPGRALTGDLPMLWLSSGKPLTSVMVGLLLQDGALSMDDRVMRFVPEFSGGGKEGICLRHLLNHTAGLGKSLLSNWEITDWPAAVQRICSYELPPDWVVGQTASYDAGASWLLLGEIIQRLTHSSFEVQLRTRVLEPLGMQHTAFSLPPAQASELGLCLSPMFNTAGRESRRFEWSRSERLGAPLPGASAHGPVRDLAGFYEGLRRGNLLQPATLRLLTSPSRGRIYDRTFRREMDWGLGFLVDNGQDAPYGAQHLTRPGIYGHGGQQSSVAFCEPSRELVVAAAYNGLCGEIRHHKRLGALMDAIGDELEPWTAR